MCRVHSTACRYEGCETPSAALKGCATATAHVREDRVKLPHAIRQARRPGLKDVRRFDFVNTIAANCAHAIPSRPFDDRRFPYLLAAPRRTHDFRIPSRDFGWIDDPILR